MLSVKLLQSNSEILKLDFINKDQLENLLVVCPSPAKADGVRSYLQEDGYNVDVLTITKFIKDCLGTLGEEAPVVSKKSELLLKLSTIWKIKFPGISYDIFTKAFNLYTELRGFTLNLEMLQEVLEEEEEGLATAIRFFWLVSDELELVDEHLSYGLLTEEIRSIDSPTHELIDTKTIIFMGFKHLSGGQLDLLKSVGIRTEVIIPIHNDLYLNAEQTSWMGWLNAKDTAVKVPLKKKIIAIHRFKKSRFSEEAYGKLKELLENEYKVYLPSNEKEFQTINTIPIEDLFFKASIDPFKPILTSLINELKMATDLGKMVLDKSSVLGLLHKIEKLSIKNDYYFRWLKVKSLFLKLYEEWSELSDSNVDLSFFDICVFFEILDLDLPRNYMIPLFDKSPKCGLNSLDEAELSRGEKIILIGGSFLGPLKGGASSFSDVQLTNLTTLGPVRSSELDFLTRKVALQDLVNKADVQILLENDFEEVDIAWLDLLENYEVKNHKLSPTDLEKENLLSKKDFIIPEKVRDQSATSLQAYIDCPRKYYFKYIEKINVKAKLTERILPFHLGIIEHSVIGKFFEDESQNLNDLAVLELNKILVQEGLLVGPLQYQEALYEINLLSKKGIDFVAGIRSYFGSGKMAFEKEFNNFRGEIGHSGSLDFFYETDEGHVIIDFKRSLSGIPKAGEFKSFKKIQNWYYLNQISNDPEKLMLFGYFNLKDPSGSLIYTPSKEIHSEMRHSFGDSKVKVSIMSDLVELNAEYLLKEENIIDRLVSDKSYLASPSDSSACSYCSVAYICERGKV